MKRHIGGGKINFKNICQIFRHNSNISQIIKRLQDKMFEKIKKGFKRYCLVREIKDDIEAFRYKLYNCILLHYVTRWFNKESILACMRPNLDFNEQGVLVGIEFGFWLLTKEIFFRHAMILTGYLQSSNPLSPLNYP